jgi:murein DD-endopeptidase MepM/ murein hydrolase activator NlpD
MTTSRRDFLTALLCAYGALAAACRGERPAGPETAAARDPLVTNYNESGLPRLVEGKTLLVSFVSPSPLGELEGSLPVFITPESAGGKELEEKQPLFFYPDADRRVMRTFLSAPLDVVEVPRELRVYPREQHGDEHPWRFTYSIRRGVYREATLTLDKDFSSPSEEIIQHQRKDFEEMVEILKGRTERKWSQPFIKPTDQGDIDNFGVRRTVNGTKRYRHRGLDFHAPMGTEVHAVNDGTVVLSTEQWTAGQTICLDHGGGVFSKYAHLSKKRVQEGEKVKQGQVIALSGNSGGQKAPPHLHLDIIVNGIHVDPKYFMRTAAQLLDAERANPIPFSGQQALPDGMKRKSLS